MDRKVSRLAGPQNWLFKGSSLKVASIAFSVVAGSGEGEEEILKNFPKLRDDLEETTLPSRVPHLRCHRETFDAGVA